MVRPTRKFFCAALALMVAAADLNAGTSLAFARGISAPAAPELKVDGNPVTVEIPHDLGTIDSRTQIRPIVPTRTVIMIKDAHSIPQAQHRLSEIIQYLHSKYGINTVGVEGTAGFFDTILYDSIPDEEIKKSIVESYLSSG